MEDIIEWSGYRDGAVPASEVERKYRSDCGETVVISKEGKTYNCHPVQYGYGWDADKGQPEFTIEEGAYPIRFEYEAWHNIPKEI